MALSRNYLNFAVTAIFLSSLTLPVSGGIETSRPDEEPRKMVMGSRPPGCENKCMSCMPCEATLVIPPHKNQVKLVTCDETSSHREDLFSWKCRCGNKLYQP